MTAWIVHRITPTSWQAFLSWILEEPIDWRRVQISGACANRQLCLGTKRKIWLRPRCKTSGIGGKFYHAFRLVAPALDNYTYSLFAVEHGPELYPVGTRAD
jgi:hypothetical protein